MDQRPLTHTGIEPVDDLPWGAHLCLFYETAQDLIETNAEFIGAGLAHNEFCFWALSSPIGPAEAIEGLSRSIPNFDRHLAAGNIEIVPGYKWYLRGADIDPQRITSGWSAKLDDALARGFTGMRVSGNAFWLESQLWADFQEYEGELDSFLEGKKMIALCTYPLHAARSVDVLDVARAHQFSIARRNGHWEVLQAPELQEMARRRGPVHALSGPFPGHELLTPRERVVLSQVTKGASSKESARLLGISPRTVEFHRANIMQKLGARNVAELLSKMFSE